MITPLAAVPTVTYTVKEVLDEIRGELKEIRGVFLTRLDTVEKEVATLKSERENKKVFRENWIALIALAAAVAASWASFFGPIRH